jgi:hypothetical protein
VATRFATDASHPRVRTTSHVEDPETDGVALSREEAGSLSRVAVALHFGRFFQKLGLRPIASALSLGYALTQELTLQVPVWRCLVPPFREQEYVGGFYQTKSTGGAILTEQGWRATWDVAAGRTAFIGLRLDVASRVARAARGAWNELDHLPVATPEEAWGSEFAWLRDGSVAAPAEYFALPQRGVVF